MRMKKNVFKNFPPLEKDPVCNPAMGSFIIIREVTKECRVAQLLLHLVKTTKSLTFSIPCSSSELPDHVM